MFRPRRSVCLDFDPQTKKLNDIKKWIFQRLRGSHLRLSSEWSFQCCRISRQRSARCSFPFWIIFLFPTDAKHLIKRWLQINLFILFIWLLTPWTTPGTSIGSGGIFSYEGVYLSSLVTIKANALFFVFYALVSSLSFSRLAAGLKSLKFSESLIVILLFCARGIDIFESEYLSDERGGKASRI